MENYPHEKTKYVIIGATSLLVALVLLYGALYLIRSRTQGLETAIPTVSPTLFVLPSFTPIPTSAVALPTLDPTAAANNSPVDQKILELRQQYEVVNNPDIVVHNSTPYENDYFMVATEAVDQKPQGYYKVVVYPKVDDTQVVQAEFRTWLKSLSLPDSAISQLEIQYESIAGGI